MYVGHINGDNFTLQPYLMMSYLTVRLRWDGVVVFFPLRKWKIWGFDWVTVGSIGYLKNGGRWA